MVKIGKHKENRPDFDDMMNEVEQEIEGQESEQTIIDRVPELKQLNTNIDKATTAVVNGRLGLESAIQKYNLAEAQLKAAVTDISDKVDSINTHIDDVVKTAPDTFKITVTLSEDYERKLTEKFEKQHQRLVDKMAEHYREVNDMFLEQTRKTSKRYKEYDGTYLGYYSQWFFFFFFTLGIFMFIGIIFTMVGKLRNWF
jgi:chromosome segregation ATPase